jgi:hypothetical protein
MAAADANESLLLALPDPCLLAVLQCCAADDQRSVLSAARAHSRLHQAAVLAVRSITAVVAQQRQLDDMLLYLSKHRQHIDSVSIKYKGVQVHPTYIHLSVLLDAASQLCSWELNGVLLVQSSCNEFQGMLPPTLTQLQLSSCGLCGTGTAAALAAAVSQLSGLQHLSLRGLSTHRDWYVFPAGVLQQLQQLTYLELEHAIVDGVDEDSPALQPLQALTRLEDLRLRGLAGDAEGTRVTASMLVGAHLLTRLDLDPDFQLEPAVLAGKTRLQHLQMANSMVEGAAELAQLLSLLQPLQQLTHLDLTATLWAYREEELPPAADYAVLTASSRLQHLNISRCTLPGGAWQHIFPSGRQLPHLRELNINQLEQHSRAKQVAPEGSRLVSCCPGLQCLDMRGVPHGAELLVQLQGLSGLHTLHLGHQQSAEADGLQGVY